VQLQGIPDLIGTWIPDNKKSSLGSQRGLRDKIISAGTMNLQHHVYQKTIDSAK
jgi:hypothetical protein